MPWRFWLVTVPAKLLDAFFIFYSALLTAVTIACVGSVVYSVTALAFGFPPIW